MPILDVFQGRTPRLPILGRIRFGVFEGRPTETETLVFTSKTLDHLKALQEDDSIGGEIEQYQPQGTREGEWRLISATDTLRVQFPFPKSDDNFSQFYEQWGRSGLHRRCDGFRCEIFSEGQVLSDACLCRQEGERKCVPTTRLRFFLQQTPGIGIWEMSTTSKWAMFEIHDIMAFLSRFDGQMHRLPLLLTYHPRTLTYTDNTGQQRKTTKRVVALNLAVPYNDLSRAMAEAEAIEEGAAEALPPEGATLDQTQETSEAASRKEPAHPERAETWKEPTLPERPADEQADGTATTVAPERAEAREKPVGDERTDHEDPVTQSWLLSLKDVAPKGQEGRVLNIALRVAHELTGVRRLEDTPRERQNEVYEEVVRRVWEEDAE